MDFLITDRCDSDQGHVEGVEERIAFEQAEADGSYANDKGDQPRDYDCAADRPSVHHCGTSLLLFDLGLLFDLNLDRSGHARNTRYRLASHHEVGGLGGLNRYRTGRREALADLRGIGTSVFRRPLEIDLRSAARRPGNG